MGSKKINHPVVIFTMKGSRSCLNERAQPPRGAGKAHYAVCLIRKEEPDGKITSSRGIGILYPDLHHLHFAPESSNLPEKFWRSMYAASITSRLHVSELSAQMAVLISDESIPLSDPRFTALQCSIGYGYSLEAFRDEVLAQEIPSADLEKIADGFKFCGAELEVSTIQVFKKTRTTSSLLSYPRGGISSLELA